MCFLFLTGKVDRRARVQCAAESGRVRKNRTFMDNFHGDLKQAHTHTNSLSSGVRFTRAVKINHLGVGEPNEQSKWYKVMETNKSSRFCLVITKFTVLMN